MPQSSRTRAKVKNVSKPDRAREIMLAAASLDRRRQAQIANQVKAINRLMAQHHRHPEMVQDLVYGEEMRTLHEAAAELVARTDELTDALRRVVKAAETQDPTKLADSLNHAEHVLRTSGVGPVSSPVTSA